MTDQQLIDALIERVTGLSGRNASDARRMRSIPIGTLVDGLPAHVDRAASLHSLTCALAGLLDQPTPERRAAALAALDLQETR